MTKIEPPPKCPGTQALSYLCFFQLTTERKSVKNALPFINYSVMQSIFFLKFSVGLDVMIETGPIFSWAHRGTVTST